MPLAPLACVPAQDVAVLLYTGGTTGVPKGAMLTHRNLVTNTLQFARWYAFEPGTEVALGAIPMFHSGGMSGVLNVPLSAGATLLVMPRFQAAAVVGIPDAYRGEVVAAFVVPRAGYQVHEDELLVFCRTRLSTYKIPRRLTFRASLPTSAAGKILRQALREP